MSSYCSHSSNYPHTSMGLMACGRAGRWAASTAPRLMQLTLLRQRMPLNPGTSEGPAAVRPPWSPAAAAAPQPTQLLLLT